MAQKIRILLALFLCASTVSAQDIHMSDFYASPINLNPSLTGLFNQKYRLSLFYRDQYRTVTIPYSTFGIGAEIRNANFLRSNNALGYGLQINRDVAGDGKLGTTQLTLPIASHFPINKNFIFSYGGSITIQKTTLDIDNLRFSNQYDGFSYNSNLPIGEDGLEDNTLFAMLNCGINARYYNKNNFGFGLGAALFNINSPNFSFLSNDYKLPMRIVGHTLIKFPVKENLDIAPSARVQFQGPLSQYQAGIQAFHYIQGFTIQAINYGIWLRAKDRDAAILNLGLRYFSLVFGFSYDINISTLSRASNGHGAFELSLTYIQDKRKKSKKYEMIKCPGYL